MKRTLGDFLITSISTKIPIGGCTPRLIFFLFSVRRATQEYIASFDNAEGTVM